MKHVIGNFAGSNLLDQIDGWNYAPNLGKINDVNNVNSKNRFTFTIYPNPATNKIQLRNSLTDGIINYFIYAIDGQCMESGVMNKGTKSTSLGDYQKGIYVVEFLAKNEHSYRKFVKD